MFATGLRNPVGMAWEPSTGALWTAVNERDELGNDLVPDYLTAVKDGGFYGWPYSYFGATRRRSRDSRSGRTWSAQRDRPRLRARRAHRLAGAGRRARATALPPEFAGGDVRRPARLVEPQAAQRLQGDLRALRRRQAGRPPGDVLTGFVTATGEACGRPVGVAVDGRGALLVADDVGNVVWRVTGVVRTTTR